MKQLFLTILIVSVIMAGGSFMSGWMINRAMSLQESERRAEIARRASQSSDFAEENLSENPEATPFVVLENSSSSAENAVVYADDGFSPSNLMVKVGNTVIFKNESSRKVWVASADHPSHSVYGGASPEKHCPDEENIFFDQCKAVQKGESWSFKFDKKGIWGYHNHLNPLHAGTITVE